MYAYHDLALCRGTCGCGDEASKPGQRLNRYERVGTIPVLWPPEQSLGQTLEDFFGSFVVLIEPKILYLSWYTWTEHGWTIEELGLAWMLLSYEMGLRDGLLYQL